MSSKIFWLSWPRQLKLIYWALLLVSIISLGWFTYSAFAGLDQVIEWRTAAFLEEAAITLDEIRVANLPLSIDSENLLILQNYVPSGMAVNTSATDLFMLFTSIGVVLLFTITTYLPRFWFIASMVIWIVILSALRLELLQIFSLGSNMLLAIIAAVTVLPAYYFHAFSSGKNFLMRLLIFIALFALIVVSMLALSEESEPLLLLSANSIVPMVLLSVILIFLISHEVVAAFVYVITSKSNPGSKNHVHLIVITVVYLLNLVVMYLNHTEIYRIDIWTIPPFALLIISWILGIWGYRQREEQYKNIFSFDPLGGYFYIGLSIITFGTIALFLATANDPAIEVINEAIIFGHLGFGFIFLLYILANFSGPLGSGMKVNKILYRPNTMPYFMFRFAGLVSVFALVIIQNWTVPLNYTFGAYFNQMGDYADVKEEPILEQTYYQQSRIYAFLNHHANYKLGDFYEDRKESGKASVYYLDAAQRTPSDAAYVKLSRIYRQDNRFFDALFSLQEGASLLESGKLLNNLGLLYAETDITDSAIYYLEKAYQYNDASTVARANIEAIAAAKGISEFIDSLDIEKNTKDLVTLNNEIVRFSQQGKFYGAYPDVLVNGDSTNILGAGLSYNYLLNTLFNTDTMGIKELIDVTSRYTEGLYGNTVTYGQSISLYYHHYAQEAFRKLNGLASSQYGQAGDYYSMLGLWSLDQKAPDQAAVFFRSARLNGMEQFAWHEALSLIEDHRPDEAIEILNAYSNDSIANSTLRQMAQASPEGNDLEKSYYLRYHLSPFDTVTFRNIVNTIKNPELKAESILAYSERLFNYDMTPAAISIFSDITDIEIRSKALYDRINYYELKLLAATGRLGALSMKINQQNLEFPFEKLPEKVFYSALLDAVSGKEMIALDKFRWVAKNQPFFEVAVVISTDFIQGYQENNLEAYSLLLNALELNPKSVRLLKAYALEAARRGFKMYGDNALEDLQSLLPQEEFESFAALYKEALPKDNF